jgi:16S rRNA (guanine527-N7)-methyltransferase
VVVTAAMCAKLEVYFRLLATWNQRINLTGLDLSDATPDALDRLLVEPLVAARHVGPGARSMIDIGSGGGSPAIPLVLAAPRLRLRMVESKTRKSVFLREAARALELEDADVITSRYETLLARPDLHEAHDVLSIRAVKVEARTLLNLQAFVAPGGQMLLFRGSAGTSVPETAPPPLVWRASVPLVESLSSRLIIIEKRSTNVPRGTLVDRNRGTA